MAPSKDVNCAAKDPPPTDKSPHMRYVQLSETLETALPRLMQQALSLPVAPKRLSPDARDSLARPVGFEPTTLGFEVRCSIQLS